MGNYAVHCRIIDVLLQKRPWINIISKREGEGREGRMDEIMREGILNI